MNLVIIDYGAGNTKNVEFAFKRLGVETLLTNEPEVIASADRVILPGVGQAKTAMDQLKASQLDILIPKLKQPVLGICLGMQLLCKHSEEGNTKGLQVFNSTVKRFTNDVKIPQMGWNTINNLKSNLFHNINESEYMYLVHSYYAEKCEHTIATTTYQLEYASALQKENFYGVQFHPEKSSKKGEQILLNFLNI